MGKHISGSGISSYAGVDQGVDFTSKGMIPALSHAIVTDVGRETDLEGQQGYYVVYKLLTGPRRGQYVYNAENLIPTVKIGDRLRPGQSIGINQGWTGGSGIEIGFNSSPKGWSPAAPLGQGAAAHSPTDSGNQMWSYMQAVEKGLPGVYGSTTPMLPSGSGNSGGSSSGAGGGGSSNRADTGGMQDKMLSLVQFILSNNASKANLVPQIDPIIVNPALAHPIFPQPALGGYHGNTLG